MSTWSNTLWDQILLNPVLERRQEGRDTSSDRRRDARYGFFHPVTLVLGSGRRIVGYSRNASMNGLFMVPMGESADFLDNPPEAVRPGEKATLVFPDGEQSIEFSCRVVRVTKKGIAVVW
ncbi:MAG: PilZ domain-containing protein [Magnetococcales bacterium]|nr:PilZ domain-containing protein [Magnetococcales bacterium]